MTADLETHFRETFTASSIKRIVAFLCDGDDHDDGNVGGDDNRDPSIAIRQIIFGGIVLNRIPIVAKRCFTILKHR